MKKISNAEMNNVLGDEIENLKIDLFKDNEFFFDYKKKKLKIREKMGHLTILKTNC